MTRSNIVEIVTGRVASVRLGPNEDLSEGLDQAAAQLGFRRALVRSGLGSLIDATLEDGTGELRTFQGPAIELLSLSGELTLEDEPEGGRAVGLSAVIGDTTGAVWAGRLAPGQNLVCVTMEIVLEEIVVAPDDQ